MNVNIFNKIFDRLYPSSWRKKEKIFYDFNLDEDKYTIVMKNDLPKTYWLQMINTFNKMSLSKDKIRLLDDFEVDNDKLKNMFKGRLKPILDKIVKDIRKDKPMKKLRLLNCNVDYIRFKKVDEKTVKSDIKVSGICMI